MQTEYTTKDMAAAEKPTAAAEQEFFFPGEGKYKPALIKARDEKEALTKYEKEREEQTPAA
jgi:hypothetical protein